jgi:hypothetical protein
MVKDGQLSATEAIKQLRTDPSNAVAKLIEAIDAAARVGKTRVTGKILKTRPADAADKPMGPAAPSGAAPLSVCIDNALANRLRAAGWTVIPPCRGDVRDVPRMPGMRSAPN